MTRRDPSGPWPRLAVAALEPPNRLRQIAEGAVLVARGELGNGEIDGNNAGPHVARYRAGHGGRGPWCAAFVCWCIEQAAYQRHLLPPLVRTHSARSLTRRAAELGRWVDVDVELLQAGDVICWARGVLPWQGHVALVSAPQIAGDREGTIRIIEGNAGKAPSPVRERPLTIDEWSRRLVGVARLWADSPAAPLALQS